MSQGIIQGYPFLPAFFNLQGTCIPSAATFDIASDEDWAEMTFLNRSPTYAGGGLLEIVGADAAEFELNYPDTGVIAPDGTSQTIRVTRSGGGAPGETLTAAVLVISSRGSFQVPIHCTCPSQYENMELQAWFDGEADHIYTFKSSAPLDDTGRNPGSDLVLVSSTRQDTTVPGCQGQIRALNPSMDYYYHPMDSRCGRDADRTWEAVHYPKYATNGIQFFAPNDKDSLLAKQFASMETTTGSGNLLVRQYSSGYLTRIDTGLTRATWATKWNYAALVWNAALGQFTLYFKPSGGSFYSFNSSTGISVGDATPDLHRWIYPQDWGSSGGYNATSYTAHIAIYPVALTQAQCEARCAILGF